MWFTIVYFGFDDDDICAKWDISWAAHERLFSSIHRPQNQCRGIWLAAVG